MAEEVRTDPARRAAPHVLLAGGGTAGHVVPALAVGAELYRRGWRVSFVGSGRPLERRLVEASPDVAYHALPARPVVGRGARERAAAAWTLVRSTAAARRLVRASGARLVVGAGGYASAPAVLGARLARTPALLLELNARAGVANRFLSRFAAGAALADESARGDLRCPAWTTGVPVRGEFFAVPEWQPAEPPQLLVLGGSQGARQLNELLPAALAALKIAGREVGVVHQAGDSQLEATRAAYAQAGVAAEVVPFLADVAGAMARAQLVVTRAGAMTLAEVCAAGRPALLVPLALAGGHQVDNALLLADAGAAALLAAFEASAPRLAELLGELLTDPGRLRAMARAARQRARPDAAAAIADRAEALAGPVEDRR